MASHPERIIIGLAEERILFSRVLVSHSRAGSYYLSQVHELGPPTKPHPALLMALLIYSARPKESLGSLKENDF